MAHGKSTLLDHLPFSIRHQAGLFSGLLAGRKAAMRFAPAWPLS